jgi:hypothetical protein
MQLTLPKVGDLESSTTPENLEDDLRGQISLHWCVFYINEKVLKCRCPKWPRMGHLDIYSPSYGQKKGQESNWQFDSRPLKVENRPLPNVASRSATRCWKALDESYNFGLDLVLIRVQGEWFRPRPDPSSGRGAMNIQSLETPTRDSFRTPTWESREKEPFRCSLCGET